MELVPLRYLQKQKSRFFFHCCCAAAAAHDPLLFLKFPLESVIFGRISKIRTFFNSARKVRKNGIGPIKISQKKFQSQKCVDAFLSPPPPHLACHLRGKEEDNECDAKITEQLFLSDLDGTNSILPNFSSWVEKNIEKNYSANIYGFYGKFWFWPWWWWGTTHTVKNRKISNCK